MENPQINTPSPPHQTWQTAIAALAQRLDKLESRNANPATNRFLRIAVIVLGFTCVLLIGGLIRIISNPSWLIPIRELRVHRLVVTAEDGWDAIVLDTSPRSHSGRLTTMNGFGKNLVELGETTLGAGSLVTRDARGNKMFEVDSSMYGGAAHVFDQAGEVHLATMQALNGSGIVEVIQKTGEHERNQLTPSWPR